MCGILGVVATTPVNQLLYDGLHGAPAPRPGCRRHRHGRRQTFHMHKGSGLVRDVFRTRNMRTCWATAGIGHVRYPTAGSAYNFRPRRSRSTSIRRSASCSAHNGNLTNAEQLKRRCSALEDLRHINTNSDSEVLLNVLAHELQARRPGLPLDVETIFQAVAGVHRRCRGAYAVVAMIAGFGLLAFRDPYGIRPLVYRPQRDREGRILDGRLGEVALDTLGFKMCAMSSRAKRSSSTLRGQVAQPPVRASRDVCALHLRVRLSGAPGFRDRRRFGLRGPPAHGRIPGREDQAHIPHLRSTSSSRSGFQPPVGDGTGRRRLGVPYREGFVKNRYIGRTFIMPGQAMRKKSVRQKLNAIGQEFKGKNVLLVDDSIVRGTTSREIVRWRATPGRARSISPRRRRRCAIRTSTASTCRPQPS
jgi:amidophosphoribosyltransferase